MTVNERIAKEIMGWDFSSILFDQDLNGCYLMEEIIKKKGLASNYFHSLSQLISGPNTDGSIPSSMDAFDWIHATAAQRTQACIQMLDELGGEQDGMRYSCND